MKIPNKEKTGSNNNLKTQKRIIFTGKNNLSKKINYINNNINESVINNNLFFQ